MSRVLSPCHSERCGACYSKPARNSICFYMSRILTAGQLCPIVRPWTSLSWFSSGYTDRSRVKQKPTCAYQRQAGRRSILPVEFLACLGADEAGEFARVVVETRRGRSTSRASLLDRLLLDPNHTHRNRPPLPLREFQTRLLRLCFRLERLR